MIKALISLTFLFFYYTSTAKADDSTPNFYEELPLFPHCIDISTCSEEDLLMDQMHELILQQQQEELNRSMDHWGDWWRTPNKDEEDLWEGGDFNSEEYEIDEDSWKYNPEDHEIYNPPSGFPCNFNYNTEENEINENPSGFPCNSHYNPDEYEIKRNTQPLPLPEYPKIDTNQFLKWSAQNEDEIEKLKQELDSPQISPERKTEIQEEILRLIQDSVFIPQWIR